MPPSDFEIGQLTQAVKTLTTQVEKLEVSVSLINEKMNRSQGFMWGMIFAAGGAGAAFTTAVDRLMGK